MKKALFFLFLACFHCSIFAQSPTLYSSGQGLISTHISQITLDKDNFLWVTTNQGLCRFDGQSFTTYQHQKGNPFALQENYVTSVYEDEKGEHWIGAADGLYNFDVKENKIIHFAINSNIPSISVSDIVPNPTDSNSFIIGSFGFGVYVFNTEDRAIDLATTSRIQNQLKRWNCQHLLTDSHNHLWIATPTGLQCIDLQEYKAIDLNNESINVDQLVVQGLIQDSRRERIYFATLNSGLLYCDLNDMKVYKMDLPELNERNLTTIALTPEGDLLIGTEGEGLWHVHYGKVSRVSVDDCPVDLNRVKIHSIAYDDQDNIWLGLFQKGLLVIPNQQRLFSCQPIKAENEQYNLGSISSFANMSDGSRLYGIDGEGFLHVKNDGSKAHFNLKNSPLETNAVLSVVSTPGNHAYIGTYKYGVYLYDGKSIHRVPELNVLNAQSIMTMVNDSLRHTLYIGTNGDGIYTFRTDTRQLKRLSGEMHMLWIVSLALDRRHRLWAGTEGSLHCFDIEQDTRFEPLHRGFIRAYGCAEDDNGTLWFATDHGLMTYGAGSDSLQQIYADGQALSEEFFAILRKEGRLWLSSSQGLVSYDPKRQAVARFVDPQITAIGTFSRRASTIWPDGKLSFGGDNGVLEFQPTDIDTYHHTLRPIILTKLWVNNKPTDYNPNLPANENVLDRALCFAENIHLPASANSFSVSFALQEYSNPLGVKYSYFLEGFDKDWHDIFGLDQTASYSSLPFGKYKLHVKASLPGPEQEIQTREKVLSIIIDAPWYASGWAILIYAWIVILVSFIIIQFFRDRAKQRLTARHAEHTRQIKDAKLHMFTLVSHEIKTPLTLIISPLRRLMQRNNDNATQSVYEMIYRNSLRILMLVNQQMDIRKIDNGQLQLHVSEVPLRGFLDDIMLYFSNTALIQQIDFHLTMPEDHPDISLWFDPDQLDKVFFNLLSNAFKYVKEGGQVHIHVIVDEANQRVNISIYNSGSTIENIDTEQLFERFGGDGSVGLGLSLANELTIMHHGKLSVVNEKDGVTFCVSLRMGNNHFSENEKLPVEQSKMIEQKQMEIEKHSIREENAAPVNEEGSKDLIDLLNDELREKRRLRERRSSLSFNFTDREISSSDEKLLTRVADCISKNLSDPDFDVDKLAKEVCISRVHLNRKLKELIDTSPSSLIKTTRLKQAAFLLVQSNATIAEVAYTVGFSSPAYFSSNFSAYFNMTPKEFISTYTENPNDPEFLKLLE